MIDNIEVLCHSSIKISGEYVIYIDPFKINKEYNDADLIMITHSHFDHYSEEDIDKVKKQDTVIMGTKDLQEKFLSYGFNEDKIIIVEPNKQYAYKNINVETIPAYNVNKKFHPKENGWVGYIITINGVRYYIAGDTDITEENSRVKCDVALVPIGGTYTMIATEAANLVNTIMPKYAIPVHYGEIVGTKQDAEDFINALKPEIKGIIKLK